MESIRAQHGSRVTLALKALTWLLTALRTLGVCELRMAVAVGEGSRPLHGDADTGLFDEADMPDEASILDVRHGLVIIEHGSYTHTIKLALYSVHEYLERTCAIGELANRHLTVALGCLSKMKLSLIESPLLRSLQDRWRSGYSREEEELLGRLDKRKCFFSYIRENLHAHMQACHQRL